MFSKKSVTFFLKNYFYFGFFSLKRYESADAKNGQTFCLTPSELGDKWHQISISYIGYPEGKGLKSTSRYR